jgi:hypothetical protein
MFDVYLSNRRDLLVVRKGFLRSAKWRKSKKRVVSVSEEIRQAVAKQGYYMRRLKDLRNSAGRRFRQDPKHHAIEQATDSLHTSRAKAEIVRATEEDPNERDAIERLLQKIE